MIASSDKVKIQNEFQSGELMVPSRLEESSDVQHVPPLMGTESVAQISILVLVTVVKVQRAVWTEALSPTARLLFDARPAELRLVGAVDALATVGS